MTCFGAMLLSGFNKAHAQTTIDVYSMDSTYLYCPPPVNPYFQLYGTTSGYTCGVDILDIDIYYGDGAVGSFTTPLTTGFMGTCYFSFYDDSHTYTMPGVYNAMIVVTGPDGTDDTTFHEVYISGSCGNVSGYTYVDQNSNCSYDGGDSVLRYVPINLYNSSAVYVSTIYSDYYGYYALSLPSGFTFTIETGTMSSTGFVNTCPVSGSTTLNVTGTHYVDFGFECTTTGFDLAVTGSAWGVVPGDTAYYWFSAANLSCSPTLGIVTLNHPLELTYTGMAYGPTPTSVTPGTITWNFSGMSAPYWAWYYGNYGSVMFIADTTLIVGDIVCFNLSIAPMMGDIDITNNVDNNCAPVWASYDPNMKEVSPVGQGPEGFVAPETVFTYTVHFQNTGNYPAENIYILDTLDSDLDHSTMEIIASSHPMTPYYIPGNIIKFDYPNINLPDSTNNEPLSHGWVKYRIKAKAGLADNTEITNTAHIYFDYNPAIITNTTLNTIDHGLGIITNEKLTTSSLMIYPNPATSTLTIEAEEMMNDVIILDLTGKPVIRQRVNNTKANVSIEELPAGIYQIMVPGTTNAVTRFVKL